MPLGDGHYRIRAEDGLRLCNVLNGHCEYSAFTYATAPATPASTGWHSLCTKDWRALGDHPRFLEVLAFAGSLGVCLTTT